MLLTSPMKINFNDLVSFRVQDGAVKTTREIWRPSVFRVFEDVSRAYVNDGIVHSMSAVRRTAERFLDAT